MKFIETKLKGAFVIEMEPNEDERGYFARAWCRQSFLEHGLEVDYVQCNASGSYHAGTVRGMHFQVKPHQEVKLVRCFRGEVFDVIVDLRENSPTYLSWFGAELTESNWRMMYVPRGFAHGFQTLAPNSQIFYQVSTAYCKEAERGLRWNDPEINIEWPMSVSKISDKDRNLPVIQNFEQRLASVSD